MDCTLFNVSQNEITRFTSCTHVGLENISLQIYLYFQINAQIENFKM